MSFTEIIKAMGFENEQEFHRLVSSADISSPSKLAEFERWKADDGSKAGLLELQPKRIALEERQQKAIGMLLSYGTVDGAHHKQWLIDQVLQILAGDEYDSLIDKWKRDTHEPDDEYLWQTWDKGIAP